MSNKIRVGIIFGGKSAEHEVSLQSAKNVIDAIDKNKYEVELIGIDKSGKWHIHRASEFLLNAENPKLIQLNRSNEGIALVPGEDQNQLLNTTQAKSLSQVDVVFPILHGPLGEDGTIQGLLKLANLPFVGASVLGSAISMDKDVAKRLLRDAGIPIADFVSVSKASAKRITFDQLKSKLGAPLFIKPANLGSSVGVSKVNNEEEFNQALKDAFKYDNKVLVEEFVKGREIECSVLGNEDPMASVAGEILPQQDFYSYEAKYIDENGALLQIPADISDEMTKRVQAMAIEVFQVLCCEGMARVDFFLKEDGQLIVNEINTIPGFTKISMYPKLWEVSGLSYPELIKRLIELARERFERDQELKSTYD
ncbi:D-alanine--D-alanine ligase [Bacillus horti]|uniref:D-alanine--D-alanine ligase n=1 Tax=Caldalkalibacillus horti TaxID=77523 RepID=A0ABT9W3X6_9BACI|nr:D-alanine--D-alanine ligase [Bacillus horti]MDQ0167939.1 D-alanine-D-alanine ligase [Bacillus horti]